MVQNAHARAPIRKTHAQCAFEKKQGKFFRPARYAVIRMHMCRGAPVAQWIERWFTVLAVPDSSPTRDEIISTVNGVPLHTAHSPLS